MQRLRVLTAALALAAVAGGRTVGGEATAADPGGRVAPGSRFPAMRLKAVLPEVKEAGEIDLASMLGRRPVVICYFVAGEPFGEEALASLAALAAGELKGKVEFLGATRLGGRVGIPEVSERQTLLGVPFPVVVEEGFALGSALGAGTSPSISLIDASGVLRVPDAKGLKQPIAEGKSLAQAIRDAARGAPVPTVQKLPRYYPANELTGEPCPDFILKRFGGTGSVRMSEAIARNGKAGKLTMLLFWHPNCTHCKKVMPSIVGGAANYARWLDIVSVTDLKNADEERNAQDTIRVHKMGFTVLADEGRRVSDLFKVVSTPTMFVIRPDGKVDSVYTSGEANYATIFAAKVHSLPGAKGPAAGGPGG